MEKTLSLLKKAIPAIITLSLFGLVFGLFAIIYYYNPATISIELGNVIPIFAITFLVLAFIVTTVLVVKIPNIHVKRLKRDLGFSKFSSALAGALVLALFLFDFIKFILPTTTIPAFKVARLIFSVPFVTYFVLELIPTKIKRKKVFIPDWVPQIASLGAVAWCILGLLATYFWSGKYALPTTNIFKLLHMLYYAVAALFFLSEICFNFFHKYHRLYIFSGFALFIVSFILTGSTMLGVFMNKVPGMNISEFEIIAGVTIGIYALSKMISIAHTIKYLIKKGESGGSHHHRHHHHHHSSKPSEQADVAADTQGKKSSKPEDATVKQSIEDKLDI